MRGEDRGSYVFHVFTTGSPPHARGRPAVSAGVGDSGRITPACAGKTTFPMPVGLPSGDHPRMRGEDVVALDLNVSGDGSPPHARGRRSVCAAC